jgi:hypothetical protein
MYFNYIECSLKQLAISYKRTSYKDKSKIFIRNHTKKSLIIKNSVTR